MKMEITVNRAMDIALSHGFEPFDAVCNLVHEADGYPQTAGIFNQVVAVVPIHRFYLDIRPKKRKAFVVLMRRYGQPKGHTYFLGVFTTLKMAYQVAETEEVWRGNKYRGEIYWYIPDSNEWDWPKVGTDGEV